MVDANEAVITDNCHEIVLQLQNCNAETNAEPAKQNGDNNGYAKFQIHVHGVIAFFVQFVSDKRPGIEIMFDFDSLFVINIA